MLRKALVVEDDAGTRLLLRSMLEAAGFDVDEAADGRQAIVFLDRCHYDVALLDLVLPHVSGADVLDYLFVTNPAMLERMIVVTGLEIEEVRKLFPTICIALPKPVMPKRLMESINRCLHARHDESLTPH